ADMKDYDRAISDYNEVIRLDPKSARAYSYRGFAYEKKGDRALAIADFDTVLSLPSRADAHKIARERLAALTAQPTIAPAPPPTTSPVTDSGHRVALVI